MCLTEPILNSSVMGLKPFVSICTGVNQLFKLSFNFPQANTVDIAMCKLLDATLIFHCSLFRVTWALQMEGPSKTFCVRRFRS